VARVTSCAFGGPELDTLFLTSAREKLSEEQLAANRWPEVFQSAAGGAACRRFLSRVRCCSGSNRRPESEIVEGGALSPPDF